MANDIVQLVKDLRNAKRIAMGWKEYEPNPLCIKAADAIEELQVHLEAEKAIAKSRLETNRKLEAKLAEREGALNE